MAGTLSISRNQNSCGIILSGRVNFETVVPLRDFANNIPEEIKNLTIDLGDCLSMDSTCMGVLSMLALLGIKRKLKLRLLNAGGNRQLLKGLGVEKLFKFEDGEFTPYEEILYPKAEPVKKNLQTAAETVLEAHQTLINADDSNRKRFEAVVEMTKQDVERFKENK
ncbi:MAG: STAS domain-containing protein [Lentisphaerae bacterium]|nr:STAS domain-containing protein [Lentisphaerota bacterium]